MCFIERGRVQGDLNNVTQFGIYSFTVGDTTNNAINGASILLVYGYTSSRIIQVQICFDGRMYARFLTESWSEWKSMV